jgi:hypothetical protein
MTGKYSPVVYVHPISQVSDSQLVIVPSLNKVDIIKNRRTMQIIV